MFLTVQVTPDDGLERPTLASTDMTKTVRMTSLHWRTDSSVKAS